jgi:tetratricopeptide (TPR) repeat protein
MSNPTNDVELFTTNGVIALTNLQAQIDSLEAQVAAGHPTVAQSSDLIDLLTLRGQILGRIADYERAAALAEQSVQATPLSGRAFLARARTQATLHRFDEALANLDAAERLGLQSATLDVERAAILQAFGHYDQALVLRREAAERRTDFAALGGLAGLQAERGEIVEAEQLFSEARKRYEGVSPFPVALLDFQRGVMWLEQGEFHAARAWFNAALGRLPAYVAAAGHLAEVDVLLGQRNAAINRLRPLTALSDDPEYTAQLAGLLYEEGRVREASHWRTMAAARYDELLMRHPAAFADHAAEFWLAAGADAERALQLAGQNLATRETPRAYALFERTALTSASQWN